MTGVSWRRTLIFCLIAFFAIILISTVIEGVAIRREVGELNTATRVAGNGALVRFSNLEFSSEQFKDLAYASDVYDIKDSTIYARYLAYLQSIETQAKAYGIYNSDSDIRAIVEQLRESAINYRRGYDLEKLSRGGVAMLSAVNVTYCYTPMQFGYSYLDSEKLAQIFEEDIGSIIYSNYHQDSQTNMYELAFTGMDRVSLVDTKVNVTGPILLYEKNPSDERTFTSLFGSTRTQALDMMGIHESSMSEYDYVIAYDVQFELYWKHKTITPFFRNWANTKQRISSDYLNEDNGQLEITMKEPIVFSKRYILTN